MATANNQQTLNQTQTPMNNSMKAQNEREPTALSQPPLRRPDESGPAGFAEELLRKLLDLWNSGDTALADNICAPDFQRTGPGEPELGKGPLALARRVKLARAAFPDLNLSIDSVLTGGDELVVEWTMTGTHAGVWEQLAPTGRPICVEGVSLFYLSDHKLGLERVYTDLYAFLAQIGKVPPIRSMLSQVA